MARTAKLVLLLLFVWSSVEFYTNGFDGAFGGLFAQQKQSSAVEQSKIVSTSKRAAGAFQRAYDTSETRVEKMLEEKGLSEN